VLIRRPMSPAARLRRGRQIIEAVYRSLERSQNQLSAAASAWFSHSRR
jgi:hypothetical protein